MSKQAKILIVEDEHMLNEAYKMILIKSGHEVVTAHDGKDALEKTKKFEPDIILLDLRMPVMDGLEFLKQYDLPRLHPEVSVVVFSNLDTQSDIDTAYNLGAKKYMLKAWASPRELVKLIENLMKDKE